MSSQFVKNGPMMRVSRLRARVGRTLIAGMGPEPVRPNGHRILNPERLPIPPLGLLLPFTSVIVQAVYSGLMFHRFVL